MTRILTAALLAAAAALVSLPAKAQSYNYLTVPVLALSSTAQTVKASPGTLLGYSCVNPNAVAVFVQFFDSIGAITPGTTVPTFNFRVAPTSSTGFVQPQSTGAYYAAAGMQVLVTTLAGGSVAPSSPMPCDFAIR